MVPNQTVVIINDLISDIQPAARIKIPASATVIDGKGKYLLPGLTDAHVHFFQSGGLYTRPDVIDLRSVMPYPKEVEQAHKSMEENLRRYLQHGITSVIDVGATYSFLKQREQFRNATHVPTLFMTGPLLTTWQPPVYEDLKDDEPFNLVRSVADGIKMVQQQLPFKPDFIKIWYITSGDNVEASAREHLPVVKAIIAEAHKNKLMVAVHATERITAQLAVESGADFLVHSIEDEDIKDDFVQLLKKNNTILCPTLTVMRGYSSTLGQNLTISTSDLLKSDPFQLGTLLDLRHIKDTMMASQYKKHFARPEVVSNDRNREAVCRQNLKKLSDAGIIIATGTDAGNIGTLHASSYFSELKAMRESGMDNWKIIEASTINGARVMGKQSEFGSVTKGKNANLILLDANPAEDIGNLATINRVINKGIIFDPGKILPDTPVTLAQRQLNAYNLRNIDAFLEPYAEDVEVYAFPDKLLYKGKDQMRKEYASMFEQVPNLHCELMARIVQGNIVIDKEKVQYGKDIFDAVAIYHVEGDKIKRVYFIQ